MQKHTLQIYALDKSNEKRVLSKAQKDFNKFTQKIATLRQEIQDFEGATMHINKRVSEELSPVLKEFALQQAELVRLFDKAYESGAFKGKDKEKLEHLISNMAAALIQEHRMEDLKPIYDKYNEQSFDQEMEDTEKQAMEMAKSMMENMYGMKFDEDEDLDTVEKMQEYVIRKMAEMQEEEQMNREKREQERAQKPKTEKQRQREAKQKEKEEKQAAEEKRLTQSVREVYMDLVKVFHPDLEQDEEEKLRKTSIMQRVVAAYQDNDLTTLLQLQLEFERIDQDHLENIAEERLLHFNKVLLRQAKELSETLMDIKERIAQVCRRNPYEIKSPVVLDFFLNTDIKSAKKDLKGIKQELKDLENMANMKAFIKSFRIPKQDNLSDMMFDFFN